MRRVRRKLVVLCVLLAAAAAAVFVLREHRFRSGLPEHVRDRMPAHWRIPWGLDPEVRDGIEGLYSPNRAVRMDAARKLAEQGRNAAPAVPFLMAILADTDWRSPPPASTWHQLLCFLGLSAPVVAQTTGNWDPAPSCVAAREALQEIGEPAVGPLTDAMSDPCSDVQYSAARALGEIAHPRCAGRLRRIVERAGDPRSHDAANILAATDDQKSTGILLRILRSAPKQGTGLGGGLHPLVLVGGLQPLVRFGGPVVPQLTEVLVSGSDDSRACILAGLRTGFLCTVGQRCWHSRVPDPQYLDERQQRADSPLGRIGGVEPRSMTDWHTPEVIEAIRALTAHEDKAMAGLAAHTLDRLWCDRTAIAVVDRFRHGPKWQRALVRGAVGETGEYDALIPTQRRPKDFNGLGLPDPIETGPPDGHTAFHRTAEWPYFSWEAMARAMEGDERALPDLVHALRVLEDMDLVSLGFLAIGRPAAGPLEMVLRDANVPGAQRQAAKLLGQIAPERLRRFPGTKYDAIKLLGGKDLFLFYFEGSVVLDRADFVLAAKAVGELGRLGHRPTTKQLLASLADPDEDARGIAAWALGIFGEDRAVRPLAKMALDPNDEARDGAAIALARLGNFEAVEALRKAWRMELERYRIDAPAAIAHEAGTSWRKPDVEGVPRRLVCAGTFDALGRLLLRSRLLVRLGGKPAEEVIARMEDDDELIRVVAALALARSHETRAVEALRKGVRNVGQHARTEVADRLGESRNPAAGPVLVWLVGGDPNAGVRADAARALRNHHTEASRECLLGLLKSDPARRVRKAAAIALIHFPGPKGLAALDAATTGDRCLTVRRAAAVAAAMIRANSATTQPGRTR